MIERILSYNPNDTVSIWAIGGRLKIPFVCYNRNYLPYMKGEADLVFKKGKFFLCQTIDTQEENLKEVEEFIGVDMGLTEIATLSDGESFNSTQLTKYREKRQKVRSSLQSKGTKNARRVLKRLSGKERTHGTIVNHTISKHIVQKAKSEGKAIAIENLKGIRFSANKKGKKFRTRISNWNFNQLRIFLIYKCLLNGIILIDVPPAYTSKMCNSCYHIGNRVGKIFTCKNCNSVFDADINAAKNIALLAVAINQPEKPSMLYCKVQRS
jgi:IS605 OrfB family transposase